MDTTYKVSMQHDHNDQWIVLDTGTEDEMMKTYLAYTKFNPRRKFRLEKHTVTILIMEANV